MTQINVTPVIYKTKLMKYFHKGIRIINRHSATFTLIDAKTVKCVKEPIETMQALEMSVGNVYFNFE